MFKKPKCQVIAIEEHYWDEELAKTYTGIEAGRPGDIHSRLHDLGALRIKEMDEEGVDVGESTSQIFPVMIRNDRRVFEIGHKLLRAGLYLQPIIYPAVAKHRSRFRVSVSASHTFEQLDEGVSILARVLREEGIIL
jgi:8-amino-7-oxononanoate synthase